jgi:hypothetical protein
MLYITYKGYPLRTAKPYRYLRVQDGTQLEADCGKFSGQDRRSGMTVIIEKNQLSLNRPRARVVSRDGAIRL